MAKAILEMVDPAFAASGNVLVQFALIDDSSHHVYRHVDAEDITFQYVMCLGDYTGATLRAFRPNGLYQDFSVHRKMLRIDGRFPHEVVMSDFAGERFSVIYYKNFDDSMPEPSPKLLDPAIVFEF